MPELRTNQRSETEVLLQLGSFRNGDEELGIDLLKVKKIK